MAMGMGPCKCCSDCPPFFVERFAREDGDLGPNWTVDAGEWSLVSETARTVTPNAFARFTGRPIASFNGFNWQLELDVFGSTNDVVHVYFFHRSTTPEPKFTRIELDYATSLISVVEGKDGVEVLRRIATADLTPDSWQHLTLCRQFQNTFHPQGLSVYLDGELVFNVLVPLWMGAFDGLRQYVGLATGDVADDVRFDSLKLNYTTTIDNGSGCPFCSACLWPRLANRDYLTPAVGEIGPVITITGDDDSFMVVANEYLPPEVALCGWRGIGGPFTAGGMPGTMRVYALPVSDTVVELHAVFFLTAGIGGIGPVATYKLAFDMTQPDALAGDGPFTLPLYEVHTWPEPDLPANVIVEHIP